MGRGGGGTTGTSSFVGVTPLSVQRPFPSVGSPRLRSQDVCTSRCKTIVGRSDPLLLGGYSSVGTDRGIKVGLVSWVDYGSEYWVPLAFYYLHTTKSNDSNTIKQYVVIFYLCGVPHSPRWLVLLPFLSPPWSTGKFRRTVTLYGFGRSRPSVRQV